MLVALERPDGSEQVTRINPETDTLKSIAGERTAASQSLQSRPTSVYKGPFLTLALESSAIREKAEIVQLTSNNTVHRYCCSQ